MLKYDIPYAKEGQFTLLANGVPINVSKSKSYLVEKMKAHRDMMCEGTDSPPSAKYSIVSPDGSTVYEKEFSQGERGNAKQAYYKSSEDEKPCYVKKNGFRLITDESGNILTDEDLLKFLYDFRFYNRVPVMITNDALVSLATYKPTTKEEFVSLHGLGEKVYAKCGEMFLQAIRDFEEKK